MKKLTLLIVSLFAISICYGQRGINTSDPKATLDVVAGNTDSTTAEGVIFPRLTGDQIKSKDDQYGSSQIGTIVYATSAVNSASNKTKYISIPGLYFFDGEIWQRFCPCTSSN